MATTKIACPSCGKPMHHTAIACPHCGKRRASEKLGIAGKQVSADEVRAILAVEAPAPPVAQGLFGTLVLPHPSTTGGTRLVELGLTVVASPLVLAGAIAYAVSRSRARAQMRGATGEWTPALLMAVIGGFTLWSIMGLPVTLVSLGALLARTALRDRLHTARSEELQRIEPTTPSKRP